MSLDEGLQGSSKQPASYQRGLTSVEAADALQRCGPNVLVPASPGPSLWSWIVKLFVDPMALLLLITAAIYFALGDRLDGAIALVALAPIFLVSAVLEQRAESALARLREVAAPTAQAYRDGNLVTIPAREVVPGDVLVVHEGDVLVADGVLVAGLRMSCDEATLTGESIPVDKSAEGDAAERSLFAGTTIVAGSGVMRVRATGLSTRYGKIGGLLAQIVSPPTPIERTIRKLMLQIGGVVIVICIAVVALGRAQGDDWTVALIAGVSLAMAAMPEELPMAYTLYLALGAWRLARDRALVRRLGSVETLGATNVICTDKTGTITFGRIDVATVIAADGRETRVVQTALLASERGSHDPLDQAIERYAAACGVELPFQDAKLVASEPFDARRKLATNHWRIGGATVVARKGAPEVLFAARADAALIARSEELASAGMRVLAVGDDREVFGLIAFVDPIRPGIGESVGECRTAGIRVVMITGDHPLTARAVAAGIGIRSDAAAVLTGDELEVLDDAALAARIPDIAVFARTRPEQKLQIVSALRAAGQTVAMTGDGTNDALALREADIGIAMGQRGSEVARDAADLVLLDDDFTTIVRAVRDGRRIFANLQRAFSYLLTFHVPLLVSALAVPLAGAPLLLLPIHLVVLELIVHPVSSLVFEADPPALDAMRRPPRDLRAGVMPAREWIRPTLTGLSLSLGVLLMYFGHLHSGATAEASRAAGFVTMIVGQALAVLVARSPDAPLWRGVRLNRPLLIALPAILAALPLVVNVHALHIVLHFDAISATAWGSAVGVAAAATLWYEPLKALGRRTVRLPYTS
jgi:Ca2+-transporting ATPase